MGQFISTIEKQGAHEIQARPINKEEIDTLFNNESSMCKIRFEYEKDGKIFNNGFGTGFFCKFIIDDKPFKALFTNNHILNSENIKVGKKIKLENLGKSIKITKKRKVFTNEKLDYTCIEIIEEDRINSFFEIDYSIFNGNLINEEIFILQYPSNNQKLSFSSGKILNIKDNLIIHSAVTCDGSSGSPLIRRSRNNLNYIIGMHFGILKEQDFCNLATPFNNIINDIKKKFNFIIANITINADNYKARIINSFENVMREKLKNIFETKNIMKMRMK
jgi:hypothetical protein